jgi:transcriptional regulator with XRE-family HTH domain
MNKPKKPNEKLQREREIKGWSQEKLAEEIGTTQKIVSRWECGESVPLPYYRQKLIKLFGKNAEELGFINQVVSNGIPVPPQKENDEMNGTSQDNSIQDTEKSDPNGNQDIRIRIPHSIARSSSPTLDRLPLEQREMPVLVDEQAQNNAYFMQGVALPPVAMAQLGNTPVDRRDFLREAGHVAVGLMSAELLDRFYRALKKPSTIDGRFLGYLETRTEQYWQDRHGAVLASSDLLSYAIEHLQRVITLLEGSLLPSVRTRLCCIASGIAQLVGHLLFDMGEFADARNFHHIAITAAQEGSNRALEAVAWGRMSFTWTYSGNAPEALRCIQEARFLATWSVNATVQAYLAAVEAEIQAILGNREFCLKALEAAESVEDRKHAQEGMYWLHFDRSRVAGYQGICFRRLYRLEDARTHSFLGEAQQALAEALTRLDSARIQRRPTLLIDMADTYAQKADVEGACDHAIQALSITAQTKSKTVLKRLLTFRKELETWNDTEAVKNLDRQMAPLILGEYRGIA